MNLSTPLVSVCIFTYNHQSFIEQCIESVLMQNTNFPIEIIIGEDYSTDTTRLICSKYQKQYSNKIILLDRGKNIGMSNNIFDTVKKARGKYVALLDGDDYWINPLKLQKQYDYMEQNKKINLCFHQSIVIDERSNKINFFVRDKRSYYSLGDIIARWCMSTGSMFYRREAMSFPPFVYHTHNFDLAIQLLVMKDGSLAGYIDEIMSVYRINDGSNTNNPNYGVEKTCERKILLFKEFNEYTNEVYRSEIETHIIELQRIKKNARKFHTKNELKKILKKIIGKCGYVINKID